MHFWKLAEFRVAGILIKTCQKEAEIFSTNNDSDDEALALTHSMDLALSCGKLVTKKRKKN